MSKETDWRVESGATNDPMRITKPPISRMTRKLSQITLSPDLGYDCRLALANVISDFLNQWEADGKPL
jgi:hypothetical protein